MEFNFPILRINLMGDVMYENNLVVSFVFVFIAFQISSAIETKIHKGLLTKKRARQIARNLNFIGTVFCILMVAGSKAMRVGESPVAVIVSTNGITVGIFMLYLAWLIEKSAD